MLIFHMSTLLTKFPMSYIYHHVTIGLLSYSSKHTHYQYTIQELKYRDYI